ncbi:hypothetical protein N7450_010477 [Penicillium hetheringtonii]|uniref:Uncharacterized protein n=1 Tax=Penicillium hetheringtonii TaxID=911720 RepID=A0AAD6D8D4_9EURO|nr:hypothetical protein N7450_010477 [Penicillium hetheringtonii]
MEHGAGYQMGATNRQRICEPWMSTLDTFMPFDQSFQMREAFGHFVRPVPPVHESSVSEEEYNVFLAQCTTFGPSSSSDDYHSSNHSLIESSVPAWANLPICDSKLDETFGSLNGEPPRGGLNVMNMLDGPISPASDISSAPVSLVESAANGLDTPFGDFPAAKMASTLPRPEFNTTAARSHPMDPDALSATSRSSLPALDADLHSTGLITPDTSPIKTVGTTCAKEFIVKLQSTKKEFSESEIPPEEIMGMTWGDIQQLQINGKRRCPLLFTSRAEAIRTQHDTLRENDEDETIPITSVEKQLLVTLIIMAMKDISIAQDSKAKKSQWSTFINKIEAAEQLEWGSWTLLETIVTAQNSCKKHIGIRSAKKQYATFGDRFIAVLAALKRSKCLCKSAVYPHTTIHLAENPPSALGGRKSNKRLNNRKAVQIKAGKVAMAKEREDIVKDEDTSPSPASLKHEAQEISEDERISHGPTKRARAS